MVRPQQQMLAYDTSIEDRLEMEEMLKRRHAFENRCLHGAIAHAN